MLSAFALMTLMGFASGQTIVETLVGAYQNNPEINSARAGARANDEAVPIAKSGYRPIVSLFSDLTAERSGSELKPYENTLDGSFGLVVTQNLFTGFRVRNAIRESEAGVLASHELLDNVVQNVLFDAAQAFFDVVRDLAILELRESNVIFLEEQVGAANDRYLVGEGTVTDVAQAQARLAQSRADVSLAIANLQTSRATYREIVGSDVGTPVSAFPYASLIPSQLEQAIILGQNDHPVVLATIHRADAQGFAIKGIEGELLPTVSVQGGVVHDESFETNDDPNSFTLFGRMTIPVYQGGAVAGRIRQAKERYGQARIEIDLARDRVRTAVISAWAQLEAARGALAAAEQGIKAAEIALSGVQEEQKVGQRTTLDVLDAQQEVLQVEETRVVARRGLSVASFALLSAMGRLTAKRLDLPTAIYDPDDHYQAVQGKWFGASTPDGR